MNDSELSVPAVSVARIAALLILAAVFVLGMASLVRADLLGSLRDFQVNSYTTGVQARPELGAAPGGGFFVVWHGVHSDDADVGVFGQRLDSGGEFVGSEFRINTYTTGGQRDAQLGATADGGFIVVWGSNGQDGSVSGVFGQRLDSTGALVGTEFQINTYTTQNQRNPQIAATVDGGFVVVWDSQGQDGDAYGVFAQRLDSTGAPVGTEFQVNTYTFSGQVDPAVARGTSGEFIVVWRSDAQDGDGTGVIGRRLDSTGTLAGTEFQVNTYTTSSQEYPGIAPAADGGFVVVWYSQYQDGDGSGVFGQRLDSTGALVGTEFQVSTYTTSNQAFPRLTPAADGGFVVLWESNGQDGDAAGVFGQRLDSTGAAVGDEFQVNVYATGTQRRPAALAAADGGFVVVWHSDPQDGSTYGIFGRRFTTLGASVGLDHFKCWKVKDLKNPRFATIENLPLDDQFGLDNVDVKKPSLLCAPADKDGSGVNDPVTHQCCYKIKGVKLDPAEAVEVDDQFGTLQFEIKKSDLLCQPCTKAHLP